MIINKLLLNHTFKEDISIINRNIDKKYNLDEKVNLLEKNFVNSFITINKINETFPFMNIYSSKNNINNKEKMINYLK